MKNDTKKLISVIIPCFNAEEYISDAIDSILTQSYKNIEIILVDDGSEGDFKSIENKYMNHPAIKIVHNEKNRGLFYARLAGFKASCGDYIAFCDADDTVSCDFYRTLLYRAQETCADMVIADTALKRLDGSATYMNLDPFLSADLVLTGENIFEFFMQQSGLCFTYYVVWNKLFTRKLFISCYEEFCNFYEENGNITMCEDIAFTHLLWLKSNTVSNAHNVLYFYMQHENQETKKIVDKNVLIEKINEVRAVFSFFKDTLVRYGKWNEYGKYFKDWQALYSRIWYSKAANLGLADSVDSLLKDCFEQEKLEACRGEDTFLVDLQTSLEENFSWLETLKKTICSDEIEYVSFDVFDTLVTRPLLNPDDIFHLMSENVNRLLAPTSFIDFHAIRTESEAGCRRKMSADTSIEDITLDEIYDYMVAEYNISSEIALRIKQMEMDTEKLLLRQRKLGKELYDLAAYKEKKIICISDMYLSSSFIRDILQKSGYDGILHVFVSSELRLLKSSKNLYLEVARQLGITSMNAICHIGDNWQADILIPQSLGMKTGNVPSMVERLRGNNPGTFSGNILKNITGAGYLFNIRAGVDNFIGMRCMLGLIAMKIFDANILAYNKNSDINANPFILGYFLFGMHLYAVADWLSKKSRAKKLHFVARDGYLVQKAMKIMSPQQETNYFYFSRKAIVPFLINAELDMNILSTFIRWQAMNPQKIRKLFIEVLKNRDEEYFNIFCQENKFPAAVKFSSQHTFTKFLLLFYQKMIDKEKLEQYKERGKKFFATEICPGDAFFDLGYSGRNEEFLSNLLQITLYTYYIHINADVCGKRKNLSNFDMETFYETSPAMFVLLRELLFARLGPSCIGYKIAGEDFVPVFEDYIYKFQVDYYINKIQESALQFVKDFSTTFASFKNELHYRKYDASMPFEYFLHFAKDIDKKLFSSVPFEDDLYGGVTLNVEAYWKKLQQNVTESSIIHENSSDTNLADVKAQLEKLRVKYMEKEKISRKSMRELESIQLRVKTMQDELDRRWLALNALCVHLQKYMHISMKDIAFLEPEQIAQNLTIVSPPDFDEQAYCRRNPDVKAAVDSGQFPSAFYHYIVHGKKENRSR